MTKRVDLPVVSAPPRTLGRREVLQGLMGAAGAGLALPAIAQDHPVRDHLAHADRVAAADTRASVPGAKPVFLDAHQMATLVSLAERIVPGSTQARVAPFVDQLSPSTRPTISGNSWARSAGSTPRPRPATSTRGRR